MKTYKMTNRYRKEHSFTPQDDGTILWEGDFEWGRISYADEGLIINMVDPSGGPYLCEDMPVETISKEIKGMVISHFKPTLQCYRIYLKPSNNESKTGI